MTTARRCGRSKRSSRSVPCWAVSAFICFRQLSAIYGDQHRLVRCWAIEGSVEDLLSVTDERYCQIARSATSAMRGELQQCGRPVPAEPGRIDEVIDFIEEHGDRALRGALILWLIHLPAGGGAQHPGVDLDRSLP